MDVNICLKDSKLKFNQETLRSPFFVCFFLYFVAHKRMIKTVQNRTIFSQLFILAQLILIRRF